MDNPFLSPSILSLCPGFLGLERGLQRAIGKIRVAAYVEIEAFIIANLIAGMEAGMVDAAPVWTNVKTFDAKPFRKKIHGIIGGYPCQPFSLAGQRKGHEDPRHLWPYIHGIIQTTGPVWCFFENVSGHLSMGYDQVYRDLRALGYAVEAGIFTAEEVGAPHERERLFILAISEQFIRYSRRKRIRWEAWTNIDWGGTGAELAIPNNYGYDGPENGQSTNQGEGRSEAGPHHVLQFEGCNLASLNETMELTNSNERRLAEWQQGQERCAAVCDLNIIRASEAGISGTLETITGRNGQSILGTCGTDGQGTELHSTNSELADTDTEQLQNGQCQRRNDEQEFTAIAGIYSQWPAGPGNNQYPWEEKRTIEPGVGSTINGYNFREDLLRAYGNSVVEQTAGLAFVSLLKKFLKIVATD